MSARVRARDRITWGRLGLAVALLGLVLGGIPLGPFGYSNPTASLTNRAAPALSLGVASASTVFANVTSVSNYTTPVNLSPLFYGVNIRADSPFTSADALYLADTDALTWRYPGGNIAEVYNYTNENGTKWNGIRNVTEPNNIRNFIALCKSVHCHPILQLPAEINSSSTDAYYVSYLEHILNFTPAIWEFGNEPALWTNFSRPIPTSGPEAYWPWANWDLPNGTNATPSTYSAIVPSLIRAIRSVDPTTPIDPLGGVGGGSANDSTWVSAVMSAVVTAHQSVQYLSIHSYLGDPQAAGNNSSFYGPVYHGPYTLPKVIATVSASILAACPSCTGSRHVGILASEAGVSNGKTNAKFETGFPMDMWNAVQAIQSAQASLSSIDYFADYNGYPGSFITASEKLNPSYFLFKDITPFLGSTVLNVTLSNNDSGMLQIGGYWGTGNTWSLLIVNLDSQNSARVNLTGSGFPARGNFEYYRWNGSTPEPVGNATSSLNGTTVGPNSMELITDYPLRTVTPPPAPTGIFVASYNGTQAQVSWNQPAYPIEYDTVTYGTPTDSAYPYCTRLGNFSTGNATGGIIVPGLTPETSYCFAVTAWSAAGEGPNSSYVNVTTRFGPPSTFLVRSEGTNFLDVSWKNPSIGLPDVLANVTFILGYATATGCVPVKEVLLGPVGTYNATGLEAGIFYCLQVEALDENGVFSENEPLDIATLGDGTNPQRATLVSNEIVGGDLKAYVTTGLHVSSGDLILVGIGVRGTTDAVVPTVTDSGGNRFRLLRSERLVNVTGPGNYLYVYEAAPATGSSSDIFTCIPWNGTNRLPGACEVLVYGNVSTTFPIDTLSGISAGGTSGGGFDPFIDVNTTAPNDTVVLLASQASSVSGGLNITSGTAARINWTNAGGAVHSEETVADGSAQVTAFLDNYNFSLDSNATTGSNWLSFSGAIRGISQIPPPTNLTLTVVGNASLSLRWSNPTGSFQNDTVYYSTGLDFAPVFLGAVRTNATLSDLIPGTTYYVFVKVTTSAGLFGTSLVVVGTTEASPPTPPTQLIVTSVTTDSATLVWTPSNGPNLNTIVAEASDLDGSCGIYSTVVNDTGPNATTATVEGLAPAETVCFEVRQWNATGPSSPSSPTAATTVPNAPSHLSVHATTATSVSLAWASPSGQLVNTTVYWGTTCSVYTESNSTDGASTSYTVSNLTPATSYCFAVAAWSLGGSSAVSTPALDFTGQGNLTSLRVDSTTTTTASLTWSNPAGSLLYDTVGWGTSCNAFTNSTTADPPVTSFSVTGLDSATWYCFLVTVYSSGNESVASGTASGTTHPNAPTSPSVTETTETTVTLSWTNPAGDLIDEYAFWQAGPSCASATPIEVGSAATSYTLAGLSMNTLYCFFVEAVSAGGDSIPSSTVQAVTASKPPPPTFLTISGATASSIDLAWINPSVPGLVNDTVFYGTICGTWTARDSTGGADSAYRFSGLVSGTRFCFAVQVWNSTGASRLTYLNGTTFGSPMGGQSGLLGLPGHEGAYLLVGLGALAAGLTAGIVILSRRRSKPRVNGAANDPPHA